MSKTIIRGYDIGDVTSSMRRMLAEASHDVDLRELATSVVHSNPSNDIYDWVKANVQYVPDPVEVELFQHPSRMVRDFRAGKDLSGDCITGDTPIWIRDGSAVEPVEVRELIPDCDYALFSNNIDILTPTGFQPLISVTRKRNRSEVVRFLLTSDIGLTKKHKVVSNPANWGNAYVEAEKCDSVLCYYPELGVGEGSYDAGWIYGLFFTDGTCSVRSKLLTLGGENWGISNIDENRLDRARSILEKLYPSFVFEIRRYPSNCTPTNYGTRSKPLLDLVSKLKDRHNDGTWGRFVREVWRNNFYNRYGVKKVPLVVLHGSLDMARGFWDGAMEGNGYKVGHAISSGAKLSTIGLYSIARKLGKLVTIEADREFAWVHERALYSYNRHNLSVTESKPVGEVFDIATATGEFVAGDVAVKNCDDIALLTVAMLQAVGVKSRVVLIDTSGQGLDHAVAQAWSDKLGDWLFCDPSTGKVPFGWAEKYSSMLVV